MASKRLPAVAGMFYPDKASKLDATVQSLLDNAKKFQCDPRAVIAPHAGYVYSGPIAASLYASLLEISHRIKKIILLGPSHRMAFHGLALPESDIFVTPLGEIPIDTELAKQISHFPQVSIQEKAHTSEHSLEVQLPFLQKVFSSFTLLPMTVGQTSPEEIAEVLHEIKGGPETLIVVSTDLSHYNNYDTACAMDHATSQAIEELKPEKIKHEDACGRNAINGLLALAKDIGMKARTIDLRNSGDTAGSKDQVVGYGAYIFELQ